MSRIHVTLKDIARVAGVSTATASLALAGDPRVNVKTKRLVEEVAKRLNYVPNEIGRSLRAKKAETIAFIFPNSPHFAFTHPYFSQLLEGISEVLVENSFHLMLSVAPSEANESAAYDKILRNRRADGIILWPASIRDRNIMKIVESGFPVVYLGRWHHEEIATVEREDIGGAYKATDHLLKQGRKRIVHLSGPQEYQVSIDRLEGYKRALQEHKVLLDPAFVMEKDFSMEGGAEAVKELLASGMRFDAIFSANDRMAIGAMKELQESGIRIPEEVAIVGYDNIEMAAMMSPGLTTIDQPMKEIGRLAAAKMMAMLSEEDVGELRTVVPARLIIRGTA
ncbi:LacI family DNA-binding transcriptional regulator [Cohnella fermenti]|uniref:LacI family transcriptional regulator n=1 Tax=Cohnella fermenti TaxID=2565925 RepID=A0A4S4BF19_9BACL|nr:LacI family DNA-binding transcriptional regulator [Cohnella fermenti]THF72877.1 LacI family transcriptional regulator [Cohnella fermenti]